MKRLIALLMVLAMVFSLAACGGSSGTADSDEKKTAKTEGIKLGISNGYYGNAWRAQFVEGMENLCEEYVADGTLSDYTILNSTGDVTEELNNINSLISDGVDVLLICPNSPTSMGSVIQTALDQGIFVAIFNDAAAYEGTYCISNDQASYGEIGARWFAEKLGGKGNIVQVTGSAGNSSSEVRMAASDAVLKNYPDIKVLASAPGEWSETTCQSVVSTFLSTYGDQIDGVMTEDVMANGTVRAYENAGITPPIISGDYQKSFIDWNLEHPEIQTYASSSVPAIGINAIKIALRLYQGDQLADGVLQPNQEDASLVNAIFIPMPYAIVSQEEDAAAAWTKEYKDTRFITIAEAAKMCEGKPGSYILDMSMTEEQIDALFQ